ncbi:MAG: TadE/TadG family type IV pilus assembly protein, partial [Sphingorhabdus sp.]
IIMFGAFELGNYFYSQHVVTKAVRDGARFASRSLPIDVDCTALPAGIVDSTKAITRTGQISGGTVRLANWTSDATITITPLPNTSGSYVNNGIYKGQTSGICVIRVTANVTYTSLFQTLGLSGGDSLVLNASSEAPVVGI